LTFDNLIYSGQDANDNQGRLETVGGGHWQEGVNSIKILLESFSYKSVFENFSLVTVWLCNFLGAKISV